MCVYVFFCVFCTVLKPKPAIQKQNLLLKVGFGILVVMFQKSMGGLPSSEHKSKKVFSKRLSQTSNPCSKVISKDKSSTM
jgi:hypothetical protein